MDIKIQKRISLKLPIRTGAILLLSILSSLLPGAASLFVFDRGAIASGEVWRLLSSPLVHFTNLHLLYNVIAFGIAGWIIEHRRYRYFLILCGLAAISSSTLLFIVEPGMKYYGGLSGLACAAIIYFALYGLGEKNSWHMICLFILIIVPIKIGIEIYYGQSVLPYWGRHPFVTMPLSHVMGGIVALLLFLFTRWRPKMRVARLYRLP